MVIGEKYRLIRPLGKGGMSRVYLAEDIKLCMKWAIKIVDIREKYLLDAYIAEINVLRTVKHEDLVRITDIFRWEESLCIVMDYVEGVRLSDLIKRNPELVRRNAFGFSLSLMHVLEALHERPDPIIYRDMKPDNIMVRPDLTICLIDFGTAKRLIPEEKDKKALGTRNYAAPEQALGHSDIRSDIYSLGKTMEKMDPFHRDRALREVIKRAVNEDPAKRYGSVREMERALKRVKGRIKRILILISSGVSAITLISVLKWGMDLRKEKSLTADLYRLTVESGNEAVHTGDYKTGEDCYLRAILKINGYEEEAYRRLLSLYRKEKLTLEGLERIDSYMDSGYGHTDKMKRLLYECGVAAFEDLKDFKKAKEYFKASDSKAFPEITYLFFISDHLSSLDKNPDRIIECIRDLRDYIEMVKDPVREGEDRLICMNACMTISEELQGSEGQAGAALLREGYEQGKKYMDGIEKYGGDRESEMLALNMMSAICRLLGEKFPDKKKEYYSEAISYLDLMEVMEPEGEKGTRFLSMARLYRDMGDYINACRFYNLAEKEEEPAGAYTEHMKYLESEKKYGELMKVYEMSLSVDGIREKGEYRKLIKSMERKGLLKG